MERLSPTHSDHLSRLVEATIRRLDSVPRSANLSFNDVTIGFGSNDINRVNAVAGLLGSYCSNEHPNSAFTLRSLVDGECFTALSEAWPQVHRDRPFDRLTLLRGVDLVAHRSIVTNRPVLWNIVSRNTRTIYSVTENASDISNYETFRLVRILFHISFIQAGFMPIHAATVASGSRGVCLIGDKYAGKTTLALQCLERMAWDFVSNDKSYLRVVEGRLKVTALPIRAGIRPGTVEMFPILKRLGKTEPDQAKTFIGDDRRLYLAPGEIASAFDVNVSATVDAHAFVHLKRTKRRIKSEQKILIPAEARELLMAQYTPSDLFDEHPYWRVYVKPDLSNNSVFRSDPQFDEALSAVGAFSLSFGDYSDDALTLLDEIVSSYGS